MSSGPYRLQAGVPVGKDWGVCQLLHHNLWCEACNAFGLEPVGHGRHIDAVIGLVSSGLLALSAWFGQRGSEPLDQIFHVICSASE